MRIQLVILVALVALVLLALPFSSVGALTSPLVSPVDKPPGLEDCPTACIENRADVGHPSCNRWCSEELGLAPTPQPARWEDTGELWQGQYRMLVSQDGDYCLPDLATCEE